MAATTAAFLPARSTTTTTTTRLGQLLHRTVLAQRAPFHLGHRCIVELVPLIGALHTTVGNVVPTERGGAQMDQHRGQLVHTGVVVLCTRCSRGAGGAGGSGTVVTLSRSCCTPGGWLLLGRGRDVSCRRCLSSSSSSSVCVRARVHVDDLAGVAGSSEFGDQVGGHVGFVQAKREREADGGVQFAACAGTHVEHEAVQLQVQHLRQGGEANAAFGVLELAATRATIAVVAFERLGSEEFGQTVLQLLHLLDGHQEMVEALAASTDMTTATTLGVVLDAAVELTHQSSSTRRRTVSKALLQIVQEEVVELLDILLDAGLDVQKVGDRLRRLCGLRA
mmetsp:Transcript_8185/g.25371  ORF Transcript_8185/g.25371 Transcript_8185/m.25371 type:complete len:336 (+) Transcript_8185:431-1438(+)